MSDYLAGDDTLEEARDWLRERVVGAGARCPCCTQFAKVYVRKITGAMVRALDALVAAGGVDGEFVHTPDFMNTLPGNVGGGDLAKLRYWGLVAELDEKRDDGGRAGYWTATPAGVEFLFGRRRVPSHARIYDTRLLGFKGEPVDVFACLGRFDYGELMAARANGAP